MRNSLPVSHQQLHVVVVYQSAGMFTTGKVALMHAAHFEQMHACSQAEDFALRVIQRDQLACRWAHHTTSVLCLRGIRTSARYAQISMIQEPCTCTWMCMFAINIALVYLLST